MMKNSLVTMANIPGIVTFYYLNLIISNQIDQFVIDHMTLYIQKWHIKLKCVVHCITYKAKYMYVHVHVEYVVLHMDLHAHAQLNRTCGISFIIIIQCTVHKK